METPGLAAAVDGLPERQRYVLVRRYGLGADEKPATLAEISDELGVSKERVRQLQRDAERLLRERHYEPDFSVAALTGPTSSAAGPTRRSAECSGTGRPA